MATKTRVVKKEIPLEEIIPPMFMEILNDYIKGYAKTNHFNKYSVELGVLKQTNIITIEDTITKVPRDKMMTRQANIIETYLFKQEDLTPSVYSRHRNKELVKNRHLIQFFMAYYSEMSFKNIGTITGGYDHADITHVKGKFCKKIEWDPEFKKEIFIHDMNIFHNVGLQKSRIFDKSTNLVAKLFIKRKTTRVLV